MGAVVLPTLLQPDSKSISLRYLKPLLAASFLIPALSAF
ncbi:hypothetical protein AEST_02520 [Alishewanella aestuarii B11]|uniref:Uncharacterized protein n=1 Tax=Alishewanella aestuarii B11 TaxID=1197174 RepID=J1QM65_9ALTE|nr:hypothetical protein AEST_02520 [Alishewanella aestuarii B11]